MNIDIPKIACAGVETGAKMLVGLMVATFVCPRNVFRGLGETTHYYEPKTQTKAARYDHVLRTQSFLSQ